MASFSAPAWTADAEITQPYQLPSGPVHDMDAPLSHYFISSGHNSYLTADQLRGDAGTSTIIRSLQGGCRIIELDCYNGTSTDGPICKHGGTATRPVLFKDCIKAIKEHGFVASAHPVIITLENHTDGASQAMLVDILKETLGNQLYVPPMPVGSESGSAASCSGHGATDRSMVQQSQGITKEQGFGLKDPDKPADEAGQQTLVGPTDQWLSPNALKNKFLIRCKLKSAISDLVRITYIPITKFRGLGATGAAEPATSSSINETKLEAMVKQLLRATRSNPPALTSATTASPDTSMHSAVSAPTAVPTLASTSDNSSVGTGGLGAPSDSIVACADGSVKPPALAPVITPVIKAAEAGGEFGGELANGLKDELGELDLPDQLAAFEALGADSSQSVSAEEEGEGGSGSAGSFAMALDAAESEQWAEARRASRRQAQPPVPKGLPALPPRLPSRQAHPPPLRRQPGVRYSSPGKAWKPNANAAAALALGLTAAALTSHRSQAAAAPLPTPAITTVATTAANTLLITRQLTSKASSGSTDALLDGLDGSQSIHPTVLEHVQSHRHGRFCRLRAKATKLGKNGAAGLSSMMKGVWGSGSDKGSLGHASSSSSGGAGAGAALDSCVGAMLAYTSRHLVRVYPASWRVSSKNYRPSFAWAMGASCVALNWQRWDKSLWINQGKFLENGGCGYVKKPDWMLNPPWDGGLGPPLREAKTLQVRVYSACMLPPAGSSLHSPDAVRVKLEVWGEAVDYCKQYTKPTAYCLGAMPLQSEHRFQVTYPEMAVLLFSLRPSKKNSDSRVLGYFALPIASLEPGSYKLCLLDLDGWPHEGECWIKVHLCWETAGKSGETSSASISA